MKVHIMRGSLHLLLPGILLLGLAMSAAVSAAECDAFLSCDDCTNNTEGLNCSWVLCSNASDPVCKNTSLVDKNCTKEVCHELTTITITSTTANATGNVTSTTVAPSTTNTTANVTTVPVTAATTNATVPLTTVSPTTPSKKGTFDAASFIGGIVLVLGVQAVIFFLYKFCKAKDRNYHTL
ncbi:sialomucin core protein 24 [Pelodytes ibericus]